MLAWPLAGFSDDNLESSSSNCSVEFNANVSISGELYNCNRCIDKPTIEQLEYQTLSAKLYRTDWPRVPINLVVMRNTGPEQQND